MTLAARLPRWLVVLRTAVAAKAIEAKSISFNAAIRGARKHP
ncbi:MAG TPA: hypothetical protein PLS67_01205 [Accumulibacter sp.]|jgi:hypothetical protein|nr:hypothetical protein [Accumulibacter sp.]HQC79121.1 hypothetical protein [Accumulibacter sp.]